MSDLVTRYSYTKVVSNATKTESDGTTRTVSRLFMMLYPAFSFDNGQDAYIYAADGDRLDLIAYDFYGREDLWWVIAKANNVGKGTLFVEPGTIIRVPFYDDYSVVKGDVQQFNELR